MPYIESLSSAECQQALCVALQLKNAHSDMSAVLASFANSYQLRNNYAQDQLTVFEELAVELANKLDGTTNYRPGRTGDLTLALRKTEEELVASEQLFKETSLQHSRKVRQLEAELKEARNKCRTEILTDTPPHTPNFSAPHGEGNGACVFHTPQAGCNGCRNACQ